MLQEGIRNINGDEANNNAPKRSDATCEADGNLIVESTQPCLVWHWVQKVGESRVPCSKPDVSHNREIGFMQVKDHRV